MMDALPESAVLAAIDELERDGIDDLVDWQMSDSPAADVQRGGWFPRRRWTMRVGGGPVVPTRLLSEIDQRTRERFGILPGAALRELWELPDPLTDDELEAWIGRSPSNYPPLYSYVSSDGIVHTVEDTEGLCAPGWWWRRRGGVSS